MTVKDIRRQTFLIINQLLLFSFFCVSSTCYMEHEDLERMEKGIYTVGFFDLTDDNIYKSKIIKDIDSNIEQLLKTDAKFYAIHVSPSEKELRAMGTPNRRKLKP